MFAERNTSGTLSMLYSSDFKLLTFERNTLNMMLSKLCFSTFYATHSQFSACLSSRYAVDRGISLAARYFSRSLFTWCIPFCWTYKAWGLRLSGMWGRVAGWGVLLTKVSRQSSGPIFKYIDSSWTSRTLKMTPICCLEASGTNHLLPQRHVPEERWRRLHRCGGLGTTIKLTSHNKILMKSAQLNSFLLLVILLRVTAVC
jgi:hypothetical protein